MKTWSFASTFRWNHLCGNADLPVDRPLAVPKLRRPIGALLDGGCTQTQILLMAYSERVSGVGDLAPNPCRP